MTVPERAEQQANIERVNERIGAAVLDFCKECAQTDHGLFYMEDLRKYVSERVGGYIAPDSPGRILRLLREQGKLDYTVLSRAESLYEIGFPQ
jgi:hypothetical protein